MSHRTCPWFLPCAPRAGGVPHLLPMRLPTLQGLWKRFYYASKKREKGWEWEDSMQGEAGCGWEMVKSRGDRGDFKSGAQCQLCFLFC